MGPSGVSFSLTPGVRDNLGQATLDGVVKYQVQDGGAWVRRGVEISAQPERRSQARTKTPHPSPAIIRWRSWRAARGDARGAEL